MNGTEQRARRTAAATLHARRDDIHEVLVGLAQAIVKDRDSADKRLDALELDACQAASNAARLQRIHDELSSRAERIHDELAARADAITVDRERRIASWESLTLWQRLRWLLTGVTR